ncbi:MAG: DNA recombination protein RmuC, partial [Gammaproteobacteria bacterium]|nr:DNA recombination protein RmuC [Gammaproteobacteria bacterium]
MSTEAYLLFTLSFISLFTLLVLRRQYRQNRADHYTLQHQAEQLEQQLTTEELERRAAFQKQQQCEAEQLSLQQRLQQQREQMLRDERDKEHLQQRLEKAEEVFRLQKEEIFTQRQQKEDLAVTLATAQTTLENQRQGAEEKLKLLQEGREALAQNFKQLAFEVLEESRQKIGTDGREVIEQQLNPFRRQIEQFSKKIEDIHHQNGQTQASLETEIKNLQQSSLQMSQEATELAQAMKGNKKMQGCWGEFLLDQVLAQAGMREGLDYEREMTLESEDGEKGRPDVVIKLPDNKHIIIDAKTSLNAYRTYVNAKSDEEQAGALKAHITAVRERITELADRNYPGLKGMNSPACVLMFMPIEAAFSTAFNADDNLFKLILKEQIIVVTPSTLLSSLYTVRHIWNLAQQSEHSLALAQKAEGVFTKLNGFLISFEKMKRGLEVVQK